MAIDEKKTRPFVLVQAKDYKRFAGTLRLERKNSVVLADAIEISEIYLGDTISTIASGISEHIDDLNISAIMPRVKVNDIEYIVIATDKVKNRLLYSARSKRYKIKSKERTENIIINPNEYNREKTREEELIHFLYRISIIGIVIFCIIKLCA